MVGAEINVVIDAGSKTTKVGFASEGFPRADFPSVVARFRHPGLITGFPLIYCGKEAIQKRGLSNLTWPVCDGQIADWEEMEKLWHHVFYKELHVPPEESRIMYSVHPLIAQRDRERMSEVLFESFAISGLNLIKSPVLVLHATGRTTGVALEIGHSCCHAVPVFEGFPLQHAVTVSPLNGHLLTDRLQKLTNETGYLFTTPVERDVLNAIKEEKCYIAKNFEEEIELSASSGENKISYKLPDGQEILLGQERFRCPEVLFNPSIDGSNCPSIVDVVAASIARTDMEYMTTMYENVAIAGGSSLFPGLVNRLKVELGLKVVARNWKANVDALPSRKYAAWLGGSILGSMDSLKGLWMTKQEYEDIGSDRVNYKFF